MAEEALGPHPVPCTAGVSAFQKGVLFALPQINPGHTALAAHRPSVGGSIKSPMEAN